MDFGKAAADFRAAARRLGPAGPGLRYPRDLRRMALEYLRARRAAGAATSTVAAELGLGCGTLERWADESREHDGPVFVPVQVEPTPAAAPILVHSPSGLRIEGLDVAALADLLRRLA